jgi:anti-sigma B factor antagonist
LVIGDSEASLRSAIAALEEIRDVKVILNLVGASEIDDDGLGALISCYARIEKSGGQIRLLNPPPHLNVMVLTKLDTVFAVLTDEQDAINSFYPERAVRRYDILEWLQEQDQYPSSDPPR